MGYYYVNNTLQNTNYDDCNSTTDYYDYNDCNSTTTAVDGYLWMVGFILYVVECIIIGIGLLIILVVIPSLYSLVRNDHVAPIYVINLLISDLLQFCYMISEVAKPESQEIDTFYYIYLYSSAASVGFMVGIALERYLVIVFPVWYRCRQTIKTSVVICVMAWALSAFYPITVFFSSNDVVKTIDIVFFFLPLPLLIFFLIGTLKALSAIISVLADEKRRIVGTLVLVLLIYTLLFLPYTIFTVLSRLEVDNSHTETLRDLSIGFLKLSPLADLVLYIFMKKGAVDKLLASVCCCRMESNDVISIPV